ncbi:MAG: hypothetical protein AAGK17_04305 [Pseudomonadota bacterium]
MEGWMIGAGIMILTFGGSAVWGVVHTILDHRKEMAELKFEHAGESKQLTDENSELKETIDHMKDRIAVLERIATDPAERTARAIEDLR